MNVNQSIAVDAATPSRQPEVWDRLKKRRWFIIAVIIPTLFAAFYYLFWASDVYVSESRFVIKSPGQKQGQISTLANLVQTTGLSGGQEQTNEVIAFARSRDALKSLNTKLDIRAIFASDQADVMSKFPRPFAKDSFENLYKYYGNMVDTRLDTETGTAIIKVKAFSALDAYRINHKLLDLSEELVNRLNARGQTRGIAEAQRQVRLASTRVREARVNLAQYRNSRNVIDPGKQALGVIEIANSLTTARAALQAQLDQMRRMTPRNPSIPTLRAKINAMSGQIASQDIRVVGVGGSGIASKLGGYENLLVEQEFATASLNAANAALVQARTEAQHQQYYLERVVDPNMPDMALFPRRFLNILTVFVAALCLYFIAWMFLVGVVEHASDD